MSWNRYTHKPVSPLMGSEAPCCGGGLYLVIRSTNYSLHLSIFNNPQIQHFPFFSKFQTSPPSLNLHIENTRLIIQKITNNY